MMRLYEPGDEFRLDANEHSTLELIEDIWGDDSYIKYSQEVEGHVMAIMVFKEYCERCYIGFFLIAKGYTARMAKELRSFVHDTFKRYKAIRVHTESLACEVIDRWHKFLGFEFEGLRRKLYNQKDYKSWAIVGE